MQTLHQEFDQSAQAPTASDHPVLRGLATDRQATQASEVHALRQRVAMLEAALAAAKAAENSAEASRPAVPLTSIDFAPSSATNADPVSEFTECLAPAVSAVTPLAPASAPVQETIHHATHAPAEQPVAQPQPEPAISSGNLRFAEAWGEGDSTFEERVAEKAFFQASSVDEQSRNWLLDTE